MRGANWQRPAAVGGVQPSQLVNLTPTAVDTTAASDWAQHEYTGYGFQLWAGVGPAYGTGHLYVDGNYVQDLPMYNAANQGVLKVYENASMPLGVHRVKVYLAGGGSSAGMLWDHVQVMR